MTDAFSYYREFCLKCIEMAKLIKRIDSAISEKTDSKTFYEYQDLIDYYYKKFCYDDPKKVYLLDPPINNISEVQTETGAIKFKNNVTKKYYFYTNTDNIPEDYLFLKDYLLNYVKRSGIYNWKQ